MDVAGRLQQVAQLERVLAGGRILSRMPLPGVPASFNGAPELVRVLDVASGEVIEAVARAATAQPAQDAFAWQVGKQAAMHDLMVVSMLRPGRHGGSLAERAAGSNPSDLRGVVHVLAAAHAGDADPMAAARIDLQRLVGFNWLLADPDLHANQISVAANAVRTYDHGHIGFIRPRGGSPLITPMLDALVGVAGLKAPRALPVAVALEPAAAASLTASASAEGIARAHASTLESWRGPINQRLRSTTRYVQSQQYLDGVIERLEHLRSTGEISYVHPQLSR